MTYRFRPYIFLTAAIVFAADRLTKYFIINSLEPWQSIKVIPDIFHITLVLNNGAAFGLFRNCAIFFTVFSFAAIALIMLIVTRVQRISTPLSISLALILGGAAGNLVDRLKFGLVIDFLDFRIWPVFNIADTAISIGIAILAFTLIFKKKSI